MYLSLLVRSRGLDHWIRPQGVQTSSLLNRILGKCTVGSMYLYVEWEGKGGGALGSPNREKIPNFY